MRTAHDADLLDAARRGDAAALTAALGAGASPDARDASGHTALMLACEAGALDCATALLAAGASPNRRTEETEETVLHQLARKPGDASMLRALLTERARIDRRDLFGWTPLQVAATAGASDAVEALLAAGADASATAPDGRSVQQLAADAGHADLAERLAAGG